MYTSLAWYTSYSSLAFLVLLLQSCHVFVSTSTLSTKAVTFPLLIMFLRISFIIIWNVVGKFVIPRNITVGSKNLTWVVNILFHSSSSLILTLLNPHQRSILVNTCLLSILSIKSIINRSG